MSGARLDLPPDAAVLTLDLSTETGWTAGPLGVLPAFGTWSLGGGIVDMGVTFLALRQRIENAIMLRDPALIVFESPIIKQQSSSRLLVGLTAIVEMVAHERGVRVLEASAPTARRYVLGRGSFVGKRTCPDGLTRSATKAAVMQWAWAGSLGWMEPDHNACDALLLRRYVEMLVLGEPSVAAAQKPGRRRAA